MSGIEIKTTVKKISIIRDQLERIVYHSKMIKEGYFTTFNGEERAEVIRRVASSIDNECKEM